MNRKALPPDKDIEALAKKLRGIRKLGQTVRPYLRTHSALFRQLLQHGWSWAGLALAMNKAGITYQTKKPWSGDSLVQAFSRAQLPLKGHGSRKQMPNAAHNDDSTLVRLSLVSAADPPQRDPEPTPRVGAQASDGISAKRNCQLEPQPAFKAFSLRAQEPQPELSPADIEERDVIRRRMFGK